MANDRVILELVLAVAQLQRDRRGGRVLPQGRVTGETSGGLSSAAVVSDAELAEWFPDGRRRVSREYDQPDLARVLASMRAGRHFTLLLGWRRYEPRADRHAQAPPGADPRRQAVLGIGPHTVVPACEHPSRPVPPTRNSGTRSLDCRYHPTLRVTTGPVEKGKGKVAAADGVHTRPG